jgi:alcohol dehydrogenase class IV
LAVSDFTPGTSPHCCCGHALNSIAYRARPLRFGAKNKSAAAEAAALVGLSHALEEQLGGELHIP